eukprot:m.202542 g.202542  ORF g.202542 m.202542 type:complete len:937 (-) comp15751_c0_seq8:6552-9362(-)
MMALLGNDSMNPITIPSDDEGDVVVEVEDVKEVTKALLRILPRERSAAISVEELCGQLNCTEDVIARFLPTVIPRHTRWCRDATLILEEHRVMISTIEEGTRVVKLWLQPLTSETEKKQESVRHFLDGEFNASKRHESSDTSSSSSGEDDDANGTKRSTQRRKRRKISKTKKKKNESEEDIPLPCSLCKISGAPRGCGAMLKFSNKRFRKQSFHLVHKYCALYSNRVFERIDDAPPSVDSVPSIDEESVLNAIYENERTKCSFCLAPGATVKCGLLDCQKTYHFPCAIRFNCVWNNFDVFCPVCNETRLQNEEKDRKSKKGGKHRKSSQNSQLEDGKNAPENDSSDDPDSYEVERIVQRTKRRDGSCSFLVKWLGYDDDPSQSCSWEPVENINDVEMLNKFKVDTERMILSTGDAEESPYVAITGMREEGVQREMKLHRKHCIARIVTARGLGSYHEIEMQSSDEPWDLNREKRKYGNKLPEDAEYLVQYKGLHHYHNEWLKKDLIHDFPDGKKELEAFIKRLGKGIQSKSVNPTQSFEIERIIYKQPSPMLCGVNLFVKWRGLEYKDATLETETTAKLMKGYFYAHLRFQRANTPPKLRESRVACRAKYNLRNTWPDFLEHTQSEKDEQRFHWMYDRWCHGKPLLLTHEGHEHASHTVATLVAAIALFHDKPVLIVCNNKDVTNWYDLLVGLAPELNVLQYKGLGKEILREHELQFRIPESEKMLRKFDVLVTHYHILDDGNEVKRMKSLGPWDICVFDEGRKHDSKKNTFGFNAKMIKNWEVSQALSIPRKQNIVLLHQSPDPDQSSERWKNVSRLVGVRSAYELQDAELDDTCATVNEERHCDSPTPVENEEAQQENEVPSESTLSVVAGEAKVEAKEPSPDIQVISSGEDEEELVQSMEDVKDEVSTVAPSKQRRHNLFVKLEADNDLKDIV